MHRSILRKLILAAVVAVAAEFGAGCYVDVPPAYYGYEPVYYDGRVVYYDGVGRPYYYQRGATIYINPGYPYYGYYVNHYRAYPAPYQHWYYQHGYRYHDYRAPRGYYGPYGHPHP